MNFLNTFLYYVFFASAVSVYGIGINKTTNTNFWDDKNIFYFIKIIFTILISTVLTFFVTDKLLVPLKLATLFPFFCFFIYIFISLLIETIFSSLNKKSPSEFIVSYLTIILTILESTSLTDSLLICFSIMFSMLLFIPFVYFFRNRNLKEVNEPENYLTRLFVYYAVTILIICAWDIMWINPEVLK